MEVIRLILGPSLHASVCPCRRCHGNVAGPGTAGTGLRWGVELPVASRSYLAAAHGHLRRTALGTGALPACRRASPAADRPVSGPGLTGSRHIQDTAVHQALADSTLRPTHMHVIKGNLATGLAANRPTPVGRGRGPGTRSPLAQLLSAQ